MIDTKTDKILRKKDFMELYKSFFIFKNKYELINPAHPLNEEFQDINDNLSYLAFNLGNITGDELKEIRGNAKEDL